MSERTVEPIVSARGVVNRFGRQLVHDHVDLEVFPGEVVGVAGGSRSGKSVLLKTLAGLHRPDAGEVRIAGRRLDAVDPAEKATLIGVLFQQGALFSSLTVAQNIMLPLREHTALSAAAREAIAAMKLALGAALAFVWLSGTDQRDDVLYRIRFDESVSGLSVGDPVKFRGVDVGTVKAMSLDPQNPQLVEVDVALRRNAPVKTDTKASLKLKGITGVLFIELNGGSPGAQMLAAATPEGLVPEIPSEKTPLTSALEALPKAIERFVGLENQTRKVLSDVNATTNEIKENPSSLIWGRSKQPSDDAAKEKAPQKRQGTLAK